MILVVAIASAVAAGIYALAVFMVGGGWGCAWKSGTGWPCVSCGGTRVLVLLANGEWRDALRLNPGVVGLVAGMGGVAFYAAGVLVLRLEPWRPRLSGWRWVVGAAFVLNWAYVIWAGRA